MKDLINNSIRVYPGMNIYFPHSDSHQVLNIIPEKTFNNCFSIGNSVMAFVVEGILYSTPTTIKKMATLQEAGFSRESFYIPFDDNEYHPIVEKSKWDLLFKKHFDLLNEWSF